MWKTATTGAKLRKQSHTTPEARSAAQQERIKAGTRAKIKARGRKGARQYLVSGVLWGIIKREIQSASGVLSLHPHNGSKVLSGSILNIIVEVLQLQMSRRGHWRKSKACAFKRLHMQKSLYSALSRLALFTMSLEMKHSTCFSSKLAFLLDKSRGLHVIIQAANKNQGPVDVQQETALQLRADF